MSLRANPLNQEDTGPRGKEPILLELGGNAPFLVFDDADLENAVACAIVAKFKGTGQTCVCVNRFFIQEGIYDKFAERFVEEVNKLKVGDGADGSTTHGPMATRAGVDKVEEHIRDAVGKNASILTGGQRIPDLGDNFFQLTVLGGVNDSMKVAKEETFGPLAALAKFKTEDEAIERANNVEVGLASYAMTTDLARSHRLSEKLDFGMVALNTGTISDWAAPRVHSHPYGRVPPGYREMVNENYDKVWEDAFQSRTAFGVPETDRKTMEATPEERREAFQKVWDQGNGFRFMFSAFGDLTDGRAANEEACNFIRSKIDEIVKDPRKAHALKPRDLYARRPLCDSGYYQTFNRDNADIVDLRETSIEQIVPEGIQMKDGTIHQLDVLIFATGFDAIEGNYLRINIAGHGGKTIQKHWQHGATAYGAIACAGFPNMFLVAGPQGAFANFPVVIESEVDFITECILHAESKQRIMEVTPTAEQQWSDFCDKSVEGSLFKETSSWVFGANMKGRQTGPKFYFGGVKYYRDWARKEIAAGFPGFNASDGSSR
ncbi:hypothetical protein BHE90_007219 [Fusarium euwallaceae]|uniref:Aldehyde dehydrogenase domain-containing protein n=1 Tax=Fusarium euwallaceae TaxID=1147111 RepID=A0A430LRD5_9HYPO|nr:hypothetical protein BHE90_007219 [Fusarium euwallaceae]